MNPGSALQLFVDEVFPHRPRPVHVNLTVRPMLKPWHDDFTIEALAMSPSGFGRAILVITAEPLGNKSAFIAQLAKSLFGCVDRALTEHLVDHETQQGWPPRECLHDRVDGAEELS